MLEFLVNVDGKLVGLRFQHSLRSIAEWEAKYKKPFLSNLDKHEKTEDELIDYFLMMGRPWVTLKHISKLETKDFVKLTEYINHDSSATWFSEDKSGKNESRIITAEVVYGWMFEFGIPIESDLWHFNRLMTTIRVMGEQRNPDKKKMSPREILERNRALNAKRRAETMSKG